MEQSTPLVVSNSSSNSTRSASGSAAHRFAAFPPSTTFSDSDLSEPEESVTERDQHSPAPAWYSQDLNEPLDLEALSLQIQEYEDSHADAGGDSMPSHGGQKAEQRARGSGRGRGRATSRGRGKAKRVTDQPEVVEPTKRSTRSR
ncbi:hypothetical protein C0993_000561, partial [Termitomyces sp. T159_Od127]